MGFTENFTNIFNTQAACMGGMVGSVGGLILAFATAVPFIAGPLLIIGCGIVGAFVGGALFPEPKLTW